jgi:hypothetical protein
MQDYTISKKGRLPKAIETTEGLRYRIKPKRIGSVDDLLFIVSFISSERLETNSFRIA